MVRTLTRRRGTAGMVAMLRRIPAADIAQEVRVDSGELQVQGCLDHPEPVMPPKPGLFAQVGATY